MMADGRPDEASLRHPCRPLKLECRAWRDGPEAFLCLPCREKDPKFVYYLSAEFLMGRSLTNAVYNLKLEGEYKEALQKLGYSLEQLQASTSLMP